MFSSGILLGGGLRHWVCLQFLVVAHYPMVGGVMRPAWRRWGSSPRTQRHAIRSTWACWPRSVAVVCETQHMPVCEPVLLPAFMTGVYACLFDWLYLLLKQIPGLRRARRDHRYHQCEHHTAPDILLRHALWLACHRPTPNSTKTLE